MRTRSVMAARLDVVPVVGRRCGLRSSDQRRVHRPLESGDLDLDLADEIDGFGVLLAAVRRGVAPASGLPVEGEQLRARLRQRDRRGLVMAHEVLQVIAAERIPRPAVGRGAERLRRHQGSMTARSWPRTTWSAARTASSVTRPDDAAATTCSIFIASTVTIASPASMVWPSATWTVKTAPGIGERTSTGPPIEPATWRCAAARAAASTSGGNARRNARLRPSMSMWTVSPTRTWVGTGARTGAAGEVAAGSRITATERTTPPD